MIEIIHHPEKLYFEAVFEGQQAGKMDYTHRDENTISIHHTEVNPEFNRKGIGKKLVLAGVEFARAERKKIIPQCSFVKAVLEGKEEYKDVL